MAEDIDPNSAKKRRIIHWNPDAGREQVSRRWTWKRILAWSVGGFFGLLIGAGIVIRAVKFVAPGIFESGTQAVAPGQTIADAKTAFVSRARAEQLHEMASKSLNGLRRIPTDHPRQLEQMILMEKSFHDAQVQLAQHDFPKAGGAFERLNADIEAFTKNVKSKGEAKQGYDAILLRIKELEIARELAGLAWGKYAACEENLIAATVGGDFDQISKAGSVLCLKVVGFVRYFHVFASLNSTSTRPRLCF